METTANTNRGKKFIRDLGIYAIGNIGSKLITFLLVPFYTFFITDPAAFGYYDICLTVIFCFTPVLSLQLNDGGFRFLIEEKEKAVQDRIVFIVYRTLTINSLIIIAIAFATTLFYDIRFLSYIIIFGILQSFYETIIQLVRGLGHTKYFVAAGIFNSFAIAVFSVLFVAVIPLSIEGIFLSNIGAKVITLAWIEYKLGLIRKYLLKSRPVAGLARKMFRYCLPLLPGTICWWLIDGSNKFFIQRYCGLDDNGLYAVALKFSSIMYVCIVIFYQAWQETALRQYNSSDRDKVFSNILNVYLLLLTMMVIGFSFAVRINYFWLVGPEYRQSQQFLYLMCISTATYALSMFLDLGYQCSKNTHRSVISVFIATLSNFLSCYILIPRIGVYGAIGASIITYSIIVIYRAFDTRKYFRLKIHPKAIAYFIIIVAGAMFYYLTNSIVMDIAFVILSITVLALTSPVSIKKLLKHRSIT